MTDLQETKDDIKEIKCDVKDLIKAFHDHRVSIAGEYVKKSEYEKFQDGNSKEHKSIVVWLFTFFITLIGGLVFEVIKK